MVLNRPDFKFRSALIPLNLDKVIYIVLHHAMANNAPVEQVHKWHLDNRWSGIGYNEYIGKDGQVYICRGDNIGAQTANMNSKTYGICVEGDYRFDTMPRVQFDALINRIKYNKPRFKNLAGVVPHSKLVKTDCPGTKFPLQKVLDAISVKAETTFERAVRIIDNLIGIDEKYWLNNAVEGKTVKGEYAKALIEKIANKL